MIDIKILPIWFQKDIEFYNDSYKKMMNDEPNHCFDCIIEEIRSDINVCEVEHIIDKKTADELRKEYL